MQDHKETCNQWASKGVFVMKYLKRFNDIDINYIHSDKHIHSSWTDGEGTVLQITERAEELGLNHIAITEHVREDSTYFSDYLDEIEDARKQRHVDILSGFEAKISNFSGDIDVSQYALGKADIKIASVHRFPMGRKLFYSKQFEKRICQEIELELSIQALKKGGFNILGHPGGMSLIAYSEFPLDYFEEIIVECVRCNVAFEVNSFYHMSVMEEFRPLLEENNPFVSIGSDAHEIDDIGSSINIFKEKMGFNG